MSRAVLLSLLVVGFVCGLVGRATYASFVSENVAEGEVTAGTLQIGVTNNNLAFDLTFGASEADCPNGILPDEDCTARKTITNTGNLAGLLSVQSVAATYNESSCVEPYIVPLFSLTDAVSGHPIFETDVAHMFPPGDRETLQVTLVYGGGCDPDTIITVQVVLELVQTDGNAHGTADES